MAARVIGLLVMLTIVGLLVVNVFDLITQPTIRRLALRNLTRRRGEAVLVVVGSMLGTAIITAALIVGNTLGASIRDHARTNLGPTDEVVRAVGVGRATELQALVGQSPIANVDGTLAVTTAGGSVATAGSDPRAEPFAQLLEVDFEQARAFGPNASITGLANAGSTPSAGQVVIDKELASKLKVKAGAKVELFAYGQQREFTVRQIVSTVGVAGYGSPTIMLPPGTIASLAPPTALSALVRGNQPNTELLVSNTGRVFDSNKYSDAVGKTLDQRIAGHAGVEVRKVKQDLLKDADDNAAQFQQVFTFVASFSVIAGILLLINIFVMLADERKSELGMLRAIGLKRNQLVRAFGMEGAIYALVSAFAGVIVGIGVGRVVVVFAAAVFNRGGFRGHLSLHFAFKGSSLVSAFMIGALISFVTVWGTSIRLGRLNVIRAIRDISESPTTRQRARSMVFGIIGVVIGLLLLQSGLSKHAWFGALAGVPIAAFSSIALLRRLIGRRFAVAIGAGVALVWAVVVFTIVPDALNGTDFGAFVVQGVILVGAGVAILATNDDIALWFVNRMGVSKRTLGARLGFAYPLARVFRTSMLLGMYSIVVFTLTFLSVFGHLFGAQAPRFAKEQSAGYDVLVDSNFSNPVPSSALAAADPNVVADAVLLRAFPKWTTKDHPDATNWQLTGFDETLLARGTPKLHDRDPKYATDRDAWEGVLHDPSLVIMPDFFLQGGGPPSSLLKTGDVVHMIDGLSGQTRDLKIAAMVEADFVFNGPMVSQSFMHVAVPDATPSRHYVAVKPGADAKLVAEHLEGRLVNYGVQADTFAGRIAQALEQQQGFIGLMRGYLALGLVIGIAGLGVVMIRAVRERRRQIGMLRAMGFPSRVVRQAFLTEAAFIAVQGIVLGTVLALITSYNLLTHSSTFGGQSIGFDIPWVPISVVLAIALAASLLAAAAPAGQASRIKPAVALRIAD